MRNTFVIIFLIVIAFGLGILADKKDPQPPISEEKPIEEIKTEEKIKEKYESPFGFQFEYTDLQLENSPVVLPGGYRISAIAAVRYHRQPHGSASGLSEHTRPFLENPAIAFGVVDKSFTSLKNNELKDVIQFSEKINLAGKEGIQYYQGVEGEGIVTIILPLETDKSLVIQYTFDEFIDHIKEKGGILDSKQQKEIIDKLLNTLKFN